MNDSVIQAGLQAAHAFGFQAGKKAGLWVGLGVGIATFIGLMAVANAKTVAQNPAKPQADFGQPVQSPARGIYL